MTNHGSIDVDVTIDGEVNGTVQEGSGGGTRNYERLTNKPQVNGVELVGNKSLEDLGIVNNVQPDWEQDDTEAEDYIKNKPEIPSAQVQSDWNEADNTKPNFIKNKPTIPPEQVNSDWNAVGGKAQILNKPTIPSVVANPGNTTENLTSIGINGTNYAIQGGGGGGAVNDVKVNETSVVDSQGVANIDLTGYATTSDIPTDLADLQDDNTHRLVTDTEKTAWNCKSDFSGSYTDLTDKPTLGTASALNVAASGDASTSEVVKGDDTRLTDSRNAKDVYSWAKESTKPTYAYSEIQNTPTLGTASAKDYVNSVVDGSSNLVTSDAVHDYVDSAISGVYKPSGNKTCAELLPALLIASNLGNVYNMTDSGVTTSDFVEGAGKTIEVGDNVVIVDVGTQNNATYKFDLLSGMVDLSNYIQKSATSGLMKNDGSVDTNTYATTSQIPDITVKADKVTSAVDGNFAGLDSNGNLTDSGHKHSDYLTQHQDISGKADKVTGAISGNLAGLNGSGNLTDSGWNGAKDTTSISGNPISITGLKSNQLAVNPIITLEPIQAGSGTPSPSNIRAISGYDKIEILSANGSDPTAQGYVKITDISESLGQTVYGGSLDVRTGKLTGDYTEYIFTGNETWESTFAGKAYSCSCLTSKPSISNAAQNNVYKCEIAEPKSANDLNANQTGIATNGTSIFISADLYVNISSFTGKKVIYKGTNSFTIQLTPHEISLLKDFAYVSTNGTNIAFDYHNGEVASLSDVAQVGETVNELGSMYVFKTYTTNSDSAVVGGGLNLYSLINENGYKPIGIISVSIKNTYVSLNGFYINNNYAVVYARNYTSSTISDVSADITVLLKRITP